MHAHWQAWHPVHAALAPAVPSHVPACLLCADSILAARRQPWPARRVVSQCTAGLPEGKPRYVMGIGYPLDIVICSGVWLCGSIGGPLLECGHASWAG